MVPGKRYNKVSIRSIGNSGMDREKSREGPDAVRAVINRLRAHLPHAMLRDREFALRVLSRLQKPPHRKNRNSVLDELTGLEKRLAASVQKKRARAAQLPRIDFPPELPISSRSSDIIRAIRDHSVVIISGETGSGKSTQLPKMCLKAGRGLAGQIACTQPRRIAAITIAHRIAAELNENLGFSVGYKIRFRDRTTPEAFIKVMTDGMLLAETQSDPQLYAYDTLIIDEAHERSLNIDFLLGISRTLLEKRPDLKLIITSATLDTEKFSRAFRNAPVIEVSGRQYPVEVEYRPPESFSQKADDLDYVETAAKAVDLIKKKKPGGDILVFMPTEQDILETCERLQGRMYPQTTVLPLFARLPGTQQGRVYHVKGPKIVVATNVAETSLTIPGIRYVVDTGLARISQYHPGTRVNSLPVSPIARSSADQRMGRCGRVRDGLCIRLYSQKDYAARLPFTPPEILRSNLAEVILRMIDLKLGNPADFPFVERPKPSNIKDGYDTLLELGAVIRTSGDYRLTDTGRIMARMPLDPKISRMLLEAREENCLREVAVIAAALSIRDPRERPPEKAEQADAKHAPFQHKNSDFLTLLNIWDRYHATLKKLGSRRKQRRFCHEHFLSFSRMREWVHVHAQICGILQEQKIPLGRLARVEIGKDLYAGIHRSILSGYLTNIAVHKEKNMYTAAKAREVMVFPGSILFGKSCPWIAAAEMVKTSRLFARTAARIEPEWLEKLGGERCRFAYSNAHWDRKRGEVRAFEKVTLYGLEIITQRPVSYARIHPEEAHEIFIRSALVEGDLNNPPDFLSHNLALVERLTTLEEKLRRRGLVAGEEILFDFYSCRLPGMVEERTLRSTIREKGCDVFLKMNESELLKALPDEEELSGYPNILVLGDQRLPLTYRFSPGDKDDGVTVRIPSTALVDIPAKALEWGVSGQFKALVSALVKGLPKRYRKLLVPVSEKIDVILQELDSGEESLYKNLSDIVRRRFRVDIPVSVWDTADIPAHLRMRVAVMGLDETELGAGRDLAALKKIKWSADAPLSSEKWKDARQQWEKSGLTDWDFPDLPESLAIGPFVTAYPALVPGEGHVDLRLFSSRSEAQESHERGVQELLNRKFTKDLDFIKRYLVLSEEQQSVALFFGGRKFLEKELMKALQREVLRKNIRTREELLALSETLNRDLIEKGHSLRESLLGILSAFENLHRFLSDTAKASASNKAVQDLLDLARQDLAALLPQNFLQHIFLERLVHLPRFLEAIRLRVARGKVEPAKDRSKSDQLAPVLRAFEQIRSRNQDDLSPEKAAAVENLRWMLEEFKVSLFAPELKTAYPISLKRILTKLREFEALS